MANENDVAPAVRMMGAIPGVLLHLENGITIKGKFKPPDMSHTPPETEYLFATNSGDILVSADNPKDLSKKVEAALREKEEEKRKGPKRPD